MTPYYQDDLVTIYNARCEDVLPSIDPASVDLLLTDPPYGMNYKPKRGADGSKKWDGGVEGDNKPFDPSMLLGFGRCILWGANWYANRLPVSGGWLVWDKTPKGAKDGFHASHAELAWSNLRQSVAKFSIQWGGEARNGEPHLHPTQKPVSLMMWCLDEAKIKPGDLVLDPYMGSGPLAQACSEFGIRYIGIEVVEGYCAAAVSRLRQQTFDLNAVALTQGSAS